MLERAGSGRAIVVNTCAVTAEAERQCRQAIRKLGRENPGVPLFVTGCAATRAPGDYAEIRGVAAVVANRDKFSAKAYGFKAAPGTQNLGAAGGVGAQKQSGLSKSFIQIQNGCNHSCAYCIVGKLRGKNISFSYERILAEARAEVAAGFGEIVLTGVDIAGYCAQTMSGKDEARNCRGQSFHASPIFLSDICGGLLSDLPELRRLRLSSLDPASSEIEKLIALMRRDARLLPHLHLSVQSGSDPVLAAMRRRHASARLRGIQAISNAMIPVSFSWDIICGFPGETPEMFAETVELAKELKPIHIHAFPFSPRPETLAAAMLGRIDRGESKRRVKIITDIALENRREFMLAKIGETAQVLVEKGNIGRTPDDIPVRIFGSPIAPGTIRDVKLSGIEDGVRGQDLSYFSLKS
jgi:threonylcarbamoyladenosine tRNA methylthiotransferase MtaB